MTTAPNTKTFPKMNYFYCYEESNFKITNFKFQFLNNVWLC